MKILEDLHPKLNNIYELIKQYYKMNNDNIISVQKETRFPEVDEIKKYIQPLIGLSIFDYWTNDHIEIFNQIWSILYKYKKFDIIKELLLLYWPEEKNFEDACDSIDCFVELLPLLTQWRNTAYNWRCLVNRLNYFIHYQIIDYSATLKCLVDMYHTMFVLLKVIFKI